jgi:hypothetical protein
MQRDVTSLAREYDPVAEDEGFFHIAGVVRSATKSSADSTHLEEPITLAPDIAFQHCANAAAAIVSKAPPFVTYRVATHVSAPSIGKERDVIRAVSVRTRDDLAVIQDLPQGRNQMGHGFPVTPSFDALSYFTLSWRVGAHTDVSAYVHDVTPLVYPDVQDTTADVIVVRLHQYKADYAPDSSDASNGTTHITLEPYDFVKREATKPGDTFYLSDLMIDNATGLPAEVRYKGDDDILFDVQYGMRDDHWLVTHAHYEETLRGPLSIGRLHVAADAQYDRFAFPATAPDPRLAENA